MKNDLAINFNKILSADQACQIFPSYAAIVQGQLICDPLIFYLCLINLFEHGCRKYTLNQLRFRYGK